MAREAGDWIHQVNTKWNEQYLVDLRDITCSFRRWMLTSIPCHHTITAIEMACKTLDRFVDTCYSKESFQKVYQPIIYPVEGPNLWPKTMDTWNYQTSEPSKGARQKNILREKWNKQQKGQNKKMWKYVSYHMERKRYLGVRWCLITHFVTFVKKGHNRENVLSSILLNQNVYLKPTTLKMHNVVTFSIQNFLTYFNFMLCT